MGWSYNRLWIQLIQKNMKRTDLKQVARINSSTLAKMGKNEPVTMGALEKICIALNCTLGDIVEFVPIQPSEKNLQSH